MDRHRRGHQGAQLRSLPPVSRGGRLRRRVARAARDGHRRRPNLTHPRRYPRNRHDDAAPACSWCDRYHPHAPVARHPPRQPGRPAARGRLHPHRLVQALVLLHVPRHRARAARHRLGRRVRRRSAQPVRRWTHRAHHRGVLDLAARSASRSATSSIARLPIDTIAIWDYGTGVVVQEPRACSASSASRSSPRSSRSASSSSVLLGRAGDGVGRLYFADLVGAGLGCLLAIPLITRLGPPRVDHARGARLRGRRPAARCRAEVAAVRRSASLASRSCSPSPSSAATVAARRPHRGRARSHTTGRAVLRRGARCSASTSSQFVRRPAEPAARCTTARSAPASTQFDGDPSIAHAGTTTDPRALPFDVLGDAAGAAS